MIKKCLQCGEAFKPVKNNYTKFCSKKCFGKNYRDIHKDKAKKERAKYYLENKDAERKQSAEWYKAHKESELSKNKEYREQNKELFNWYHNKDRFNGMKDIILSRDSNKCRSCNNNIKLAIHHKDGSGHSREKINTNNDINNLITLCSSCHTSLHHWQRKNHILLRDEDIVRTLKKLREVNSKS